MPPTRILLSFWTAIAVTEPAWQIAALGSVAGELQASNKGRTQSHGTMPTALIKSFLIMQQAASEDYTTRKCHSLRTGFDLFRTSLPPLKLWDCDARKLNLRSQLHEERSKAARISQLAAIEFHFARKQPRRQHGSSAVCGDGLTRVIGK